MDDSTYLRIDTEKGTFYGFFDKKPNEALRLAIWMFDRFGITVECLKRQKIGHTTEDSFTCVDGKVFAGKKLWLAAGISAAEFEATKVVAEKWADEQFG